MPENLVPWLVSVLVSLVFGFLGGWLLEYYLDLKYWEMRAKRRGLVITGEEGKALLAAARAPAAADSGESDEKLAATLREFLDKREKEVTALRSQMERQETQYEELKSQFERYMVTHPDDLTAIRGIGRIYQWKLRDEGISSYEHLATTTPEKLREILEVPTWRKFEPESWIEQAKVLIQRGE